jgi:alpha-glucosidase
LSASIARPPRFELARQDGPRLTLSSDSDWSADIFVLEPDIIRVLLTPPGGLKGPRTWAIAPGIADAPAPGRDRYDASGFAHPPYRLERLDRTLTISTDRLRLAVELDGFSCVWRMRTGGEWRTIAADRPTQPYNFGWWAGGPRHYLARRDGERYFGLGEKSGPLDRAGRRLRMSNTDALGYDARTTDPLYKHIPLTITHSAGAGLAFGLFYDTYADCTFDLGAELSNYHGSYRYFAADAGDLDYYVIAGPGVAEVTRRFTWLTGRPALPPKWALGYSGSSMAYADAPDAQRRMGGFLEACRRHDILCDSFHLSSGYTSIGPRRYVFHWNREKFPDPAAFAAQFHAAGVKLIANVKPCLLDLHPLFDEARGKGLFVSDGDGEPAWAQFWDGLGAWLDFTNPDAAAWWRAHVTADLLELGIDATWNDNNEFEIAAPDARAAMFRRGAPAADVKPLQTMLMLRVSRAAQVAHAPERRPFLVTRSGAAGMQRYGQTWTGDNATSWETLGWNIRMGLGLALSGVSNAGHDVGGFAGAAPDPELFVRWVEAGVFMPRFSIHSWNRDGSSNEPWMHPDVTPLVRDLIKLRYRLLPYLYDLCWRHAQAFEPIVRPTFLEFPEDPTAYDDCDDLMLGPSLLVASVVEPGSVTRKIRLPAGADWADFWTAEVHAGGTTIELPAPLGRPPLLVRAGAAIPLNIAEQSFEARADQRAFAIFAPRTGAFEATCHEDDGESEAWREGAYGAWRIRVEASARRLQFTASGEGERPPEGTLAALIRSSDKRPVVVAGKRARETSFDGWRRIELIG